MKFGKVATLCALIGQLACGGFKQVVAQEIDTIQYKSRIFPIISSSIENIKKIGDCIERRTTNAESDFFKIKEVVSYSSEGILYSMEINPLPFFSVEYFNTCLDVKPVRIDNPLFTIHGALFLSKEKWNDKLDNHIYKLSFVKKEKKENYSVCSGIYNIENMDELDSPCKTLAILLESYNKAIKHNMFRNRSQGH